MTLAELIIADARARGLRHFFGCPEPCMLNVPADLGQTAWSGPLSPTPLATSPPPSSTSAESARNFLNG